MKTVDDYKDNSFWFPVDMSNDYVGLYVVINVFDLAQSQYGVVHMGNETVYDTLGDALNDYNAFVELENKKRA